MFVVSSSIQDGRVAKVITALTVFFFERSLSVIPVRSSTVLDQ
jgi:hypothetical protein